MNRLAFLAGLLPALLATPPALAAEVIVPVGEWVGLLANLTAVALAGFGIFALRMLPAPIYRLLMMLRAEQLIARAVDYGVQSVAGSARGRTLTVDIGNQVIASAAAYAVDAADDLVQWLGGADEVKRKILARLDVEADAVADYDETGRFRGIKGRKAR